ncbi:MAG TPA: hypothetical protein VE988_07830 [Gemmataceae bacterium]|nr:hypothetical protein [Gemmataceae bacterium]
MLLPFFRLAATSPNRQSAFRWLVGMHLVVLTAGAAVALSIQQGGTPLLGHVVLIAGIVEGALLLGWRLAQIPKSQSLEFLLVSPLRPAGLFFAETLVGLSRLAMITFAGLPLFLLLETEGFVLLSDVPALMVMPWTWGAVTGLTLVTWSYENRSIRRWGERVVMLLILTYLIIGVLAAEKLALWLKDLPPDVGEFVLDGIRLMHAYSPFTVLRDVLRDPPGDNLARCLRLESIGLAALALLTWRGACRLQGHFRDRHYLPVQDVSRQWRPDVGNKPLSWWAVKRVSEYSGKVNLWLAGGFAVLYAAYTVAGPAWPSWLGRQVFVMFDQMGGVPVLAAALVVLAAVPAAFQYGLWDSNAQDRCRRLELLLLTNLDAGDYWHAAAAAAWRRGRGYFAVALLLWLSLVVSGQAGLLQIIAALACGVALWGLYFALGFRAFSRGMQANNLGMILTVGLPLVACLLCRSDLVMLAGLVPPGGVYLTATEPVTLAWLPGAVLTGWLALIISRETQMQCVSDLRRWYDMHHGQKSME